MTWRSSMPLAVTPRPSKPRKRLQRKPLRRGKRKERARHDKAYLGRVAKLTRCVVCDELRQYNCGPLQNAHLALNRNQKGTGMKVPDIQAVRMGKQHHEEWDQHRGMFKGWTDEWRYHWAKVWVERTQAVAGIARSARPQERAA